MTSRTKIYKCEICGRKDLPPTQMWYFPLDVYRCKEWLKYVGNEDLVYIPIEKLHTLKQVCGDHFLPEDYSNNKLKETAIPTIGLTKEVLADDLFAEFPLHLAKSGEATSFERSEKSNIEACNTSNTSLPNLSNLHNTNKIHKDLEKSWSNILCKGLPWNVKAKVLHKYKIPSNCELLAAPHFNPKIQEVLPMSTKTRDEVMRNNQQQLGVGIAAIGRVLSHILSDKNQEGSKMIPILSDACKILADLHCMMSQHRLRMLTGNDSFRIAVDGTSST